MKIVIAGDLTLQDRAARTIWKDHQLKKSFSDVKKELGKCDWAVVNLESPITEANVPIIKDGPSLKNPMQVFDIIKYCGFKAVTLANNHLKDYGSVGVQDTLRNCKNSGIDTVGAGVTISDARIPLLLKTENITIGILNVCEHESSIVTKTSAGANPLYFPNLFQDITDLRKNVDKIVVIIHGGRENYQLPTPRMKREYRMIIDFGADIIVNHHQHCFSGYELYKGKPIIYGLGNFFFDRVNCRNNKWNYGLLAEFDLCRDKIDFRLVPYEQCNDEAVVTVLDYECVREKIESLNEIIKDDQMLEMEFERMVSSAKMLSPFIPFGNHLLRSLYYRGMLPNFISKKNMALIENYISCETHRELLLHYFYNKNRR